MIKCSDKAMRIQAIRYASGKKGVARAVRRFNKRKCPISKGFDANSRYPANFKHCRSFEETYNSK